MLPGDQVEPGGALLQDTAEVVKASCFSRGQHSNQLGSLGAIAVTKSADTSPSPFAWRNGSNTL
jgi:hypothetical protein